MAKEEKGQQMIAVESYPFTPGWKTDKIETSREAAKSVASTADDVRDLCYAEILRKPQTSDEVAANLGRTVLSIRPRCAELLAQGKIVRHVIGGKPARRNNVSGRSAAVWTVAQTYRQEELI